MSLTTIAKSLFLPLLCLLLQDSAYGQRYTSDDTRAYIEKYSPWAVEEMKKSGIPASITIAQGILESASGKSRLATKANNHFGIKCHKWTGAKIYHDDDAKGECFRKYKSAKNSFKDHSQFLQTRSRYAFLFELEPDDYEGWAHGLKKAGYATNPKYAYILIGIIQRYNLDELDKTPSPVETRPIATTEKTKLNIKPKVNPIVEPEKIKTYPKGTFEVNGLKVVYFQPNETIADIASRHNIEVEKLEKFNDVSEENNLQVGMYVFLESKRNKSSNDVHLVKADQSLYEISQLAGIRLKSLKKRNLIEEGKQPAPGQVLYLKSKRSEPVKYLNGLDYTSYKPGISKKPVSHQVRGILQDRREDYYDNKQLSKHKRGELDLASRNRKIDSLENILNSIDTELPDLDMEAIRAEANRLAKEQMEEEERKNQSIQPETNYPLTDEKNVSIELAPKVKEKPKQNPLEEEEIEIDEEIGHIKSTSPIKPSPAPKSHIVEKGQTLYAISRMYNVSVGQIKTWNNLKNNDLSIGQKLIVSEK